MNARMLASAVVLVTGSAVAQSPTSAPTFIVPASALSAHPIVIVYGDQRFHDPRQLQGGRPGHAACACEKDC